jgi:hypothetical protein
MYSSSCGTSSGFLVYLPSITDAIEKPVLNTVNATSSSVGNHLVSVSIYTNETTREYLYH